MSTVELLFELRRLGSEARTDAERLLARDVDRLPGDLRARLREHQLELLELVRRLTNDASSEREVRGAAIRLYSRLIGEEVFLVETATDANALEAELAAEGDNRPVFSVAEVLRIGEMAEADRQEFAAALARVKRVTPGARLEAVGCSMRNTGELTLDEIGRDPAKLAKLPAEKRIQVCSPAPR
jgi:hypothetical protein